MKIVVDTNVIVSGLLNTDGTPAKILSLIFNGKVKILYDNRIIFEYHDVLSRKEFGFPAESINDIIVFFKRGGEFINSEPLKINNPASRGVLNPSHTIKFSDETDKKFYEVYKFGEAQYLITGNLKHFPKENTIVTPKTFIELYENSLG